MPSPGSLRCAGDRSQERGRGRPARRRDRIPAASSGRPAADDRGRATCLCTGRHPSRVPPSGKSPRTSCRPSRRPGRSPHRGGHLVEGPQDQLAGVDLPRRVLDEPSRSRAEGTVQLPVRGGRGGGARPPRRRGQQRLDLGDGPGGLRWTTTPAPRAHPHPRLVRHDRHRRPLQLPRHRPPVRGGVGRSRQWSVASLRHASRAGPNSPARAGRRTSSSSSAHLYGAHLATGRTLLPPHDLLVIDEAHEFEDCIVGALGTLTRAASFTWHGPRRVRRRRAAGRRLAARLHGLDAARGPARRRPLGAPSRHAVPRPGHRGPPHRRGALAAAVSGGRARQTLRRGEGGDGRAAPGGPGAAGRGVVLTDAQTLLAPYGRAPSAGWSPARSGQSALRLTRIDVADTLRSLAWDEEELTVVCCSATLDPGTPARLGLDAEHLAVDSPFDFARNAMLHVPRMVPPSHRDWPEQVAAVVERTIRACDGRTLALFTSNRMLRATVERCRSCCRSTRCSHRAARRTRSCSGASSRRSTPACSPRRASGPGSPAARPARGRAGQDPVPGPTDPIIEARVSWWARNVPSRRCRSPPRASSSAGVGRLIRTTRTAGSSSSATPARGGPLPGADLALLPPMRRERNPLAADRFIASLGLSPRTPTPTGPAASAAAGT